MEADDSGIGISYEGRRWGGRNCPCHRRGTRRTRTNGTRAGDNVLMTSDKWPSIRIICRVPPSRRLQCRRRGHFFAHFGKIDADTLSGAVFQRTRKAAAEEGGKRREGGKAADRRHTTAYFNGLT